MNMLLGLALAWAGLAGRRWIIFPHGCEFRTGVVRVFARADRAFLGGGHRWRRDPVYFCQRMVSGALATGPTWPRTLGWVCCWA